MQLVGGDREPAAVFFPANTAAGSAAHLTAVAHGCRIQLKLLAERACGRRLMFYETRDSMGLNLVLGWQISSVKGRLSRRPTAM